MFKYLSVLVLFCLHVGTCLAGGTILVFGDSLSAGYGIAQNRSWPVLLGAQLRDKGYDYTVRNASISGETTAGGRTRLAATLKRERPAVVILELGANDGLRGLPVHQMRANLAAMIRTSQASNARVLLVGIRVPPNYGNEYAHDFAQSYAMLAKKYKTAFVPFLFEGFAGERNAFQADGMHPTAEMQPSMVANVWPALKPLLRK